ncbi:MAG: amidohydrolase, partial [Bacteroidota bacterium]|nr:amidohydrolase [Bacteroidota bacterium]
MNKLIDRIKHCTETYLSDTLTIRRLLHQHPELSFNEFKTSAFIASKLTDLGIDLKKDIAQTGIIGIIRGEKPSTRVIGLRADMDALPIKEETGVDYQSLNP